MLLHTAYAVSLFSQTFLIETRDEIPRKAMRPSQRIQITALETGIMDILFDKGYIVFDRMSIRGGKSTAMMDREAIEFAIKQDAELLLVLVPGRQGALWSLVRVEDAQKLGDGFVDISVIDHGGGEMKRWISLGNSLAIASLSVLDKPPRNSDDADLRGPQGIWRSK